MTNNGKTLATNQAATNSLEAMILRNGSSLTEKNKLVIKKNILKDLQDGADVNAALAESHYALNVEFLEATKDLLLDHPKSNLSTDNFLEFVLNISQTEGDFTGVKKLIETALDRGADVNAVLAKFHYFFKVEFLEATKDLLLDHPKSNLSADNFLKLTLKANVTDPEQIKLQGAFIKYSLDNGAVINTDADISLEALFAHKDLLLDHPKSNLSTDKFLEFALKASVIKYDSNTEKFVTDPEKIKLQDTLIKYFLDHEAVINTDIFISLEALSAHKDLLLDHPKSNLSQDKFLKFVLKASLTKYGSDTQKSVTLQGTLIKYFLDHGAVINTDAHISLEVLFAHKDLLLDHPKNKLSPEKFLKLVLKEGKSVSLEHFMACKSFIRNDTVWLYLNKLIETLSDQWSITKTTTEIESLIIEIASKYQDSLKDIHKQLLLATASESLLYYLINNLGWSIDCNSTKNLIGAEDTLAAETDFSSNPQLLLDYKYKNLYVTEGNYTKIPSLLHHIWLTSPDNIKQIREQDIKNVKKTQALFRESNQHNWTQVIWVNNKALLKPSIEEFDGTEIKIRDIGEIHQRLVNYDIIGEEIKLKHWGIASDMLRYDLINHFGGVYSDINYIFCKVPDFESKSYDFFSATYSLEYHLSIDNFIFGAKQNHPVILCAQKMVRQNILDPPSKLKDLYALSVSSFTDKATADPIGHCFFSAAHQRDDIDVVYPKPPTMSNDGKIMEDSIKPTNTSRGIIREKVFENMLLHCPDVHKTLLLKEQEKKIYDKYMEDHEICAAPKIIIGHDSTDGRTWANDV
jgi:hypothetical protein